MRYFLILFLISYCSYSISQDPYSVVEYDKSKSKTVGGDAIGIDNNGYIYSLSETTIATFQPKLHLKILDSRTGSVIKEKPLDEIKSALISKGYEFIHMMFFDNKLTFICTKRSSSFPKELFYIFMNEKSELYGNPSKIGSINCETQSNSRLGSLGYVGYENPIANLYPKPVYQQKLKDGSYTIVIKKTCSKNSLQKFQFLEFNKNLEIEKSIQFKVDFTDEYSYLNFIKNGNYLYIKTEYLKPKYYSRDINSYSQSKEYSLYKVSLNDGQSRKMNLKNKLNVQDLSDFAVYPSKGGVLIVGQLIIKNKFKGICIAKINQTNNETISKSIVEFEPDFVTNYWSSKEIENNEHVFPNSFIMTDCISTSDHGTITIFQELNSKASSSSVYYHFKDILLIKTDSDGNIEYKRTLPSFQRSSTNYGKGYNLLVDNNELYILHKTSKRIHKMIKNGSNENKSAVVDYKKNKYATVSHINEKGVISSKQVLNTDKEKVSITPNYVVVDPLNQKFFIASQLQSLSRKKMKMFCIKITN